MITSKAPRTAQHNSIIFDPPTTRHALPLSDFSLLLSTPLHPPLGWVRLHWFHGRTPTKRQGTPLLYTYRGFIRLVNNELMERRWLRVAQFIEQILHLFSLTLILLFLFSLYTLFTESYTYMWHRKGEPFVLLLLERYNNFLLKSPFGDFIWRKYSILLNPFLPGFNAGLHSVSDSPGRLTARLTPTTESLTIGSRTGGVLILLR